MAFRCLCFLDMNAACARLRQIYPPAYLGLLSIKNLFIIFPLQIKKLVLCTSREVYAQSQLSCQKSTAALEEVISSVMSKLLRYTTRATYVCRLQQEVPPYLLPQKIQGDFKITQKATLEEPVTCNLLNELVKCYPPSLLRAMTRAGAS